VRSLSPVIITTRMPMPRSSSYGLGAVGLGLVRHGDKSQRFAVPAEKQRRFSLGGKLIRRCSSPAGTSAGFNKAQASPCSTSPSRIPAVRPLPGRRGNL
jgi:hypothetical protein